MSRTFFRERLRTSLYTIRQLLSFIRLMFLFMHCLRSNLFVFNRVLLILCWSSRGEFIAVHLLFQLFFFRLWIQVWVSSRNLFVHITFFQIFCHLFYTETSIIFVGCFIRSTLFLILNNLSAMTDRNFDISMLN